jgi:hypothetical protein
MCTVQCVSQRFRVQELWVFVISMAMVYYPYYAPSFSERFYQKGPYPRWMAQPTYSYKGLSESRQWTTVSDGGLSEFGLSGLNYGQPKLNQTAPMICPTCYPGPMFASYPSMMIQAAMGHTQPQWFQPAFVFRYY